MDCREFQKIIPNIMNHHVAYEDLREVVDHVNSCKDCKDELEINYVLQYGLSDDELASLDIVKTMETDLVKMDLLAKRFHLYKSIYILLMISALTSVLGSIIYCAFNIWF